MTKNLLILTTLSVLALGAAQAQQSTPPATPPATSTTATPTPTATPATDELRTLQREARRLEILNQLRTEDRATFETWQRERDAYLTRAQELRTRELRAYVESLRGGKTPTAARADAEAAVLNDRRALDEQATKLRTTARDLATRYPRLAAGLGVLERGSAGMHGGRSGNGKFKHPGAGPRGLMPDGHRRR